ncbi:alanine--tRNA ligase [Actinokineospora globicatena]|uniref:alanine--tRNA ligase n=1 Tax=Actinokineospora globicatena TaxID=103729 RepID=UPI0020A56977|nr:alanine--tRNA ligase [Actinokineospora globicatena]MCP2305686.1 alanyl-tRNA synthetase [Actinokineospora globicatena]GLW81558.1 alanine--tRNA ligase [Actinokineospora globicatena]GLW87744.1 alanine--tRNA ligase [Actinokineospora globicatena]
MQTHEISNRFLDHFKRNGHTQVPSASLIFEDPNLLFVNAGMVQFKPYFLGQAPAPWPRATSVQKCVRTGDIDEVGKTTRHNTFFQMAGNFSFGDYFKAGAIELAWELITKSVGDGGYGLDPDRLWATVYNDDDEALELWRKIAGLPEERIQRRDGLDNYWDMGVPGPGGPCSEIYYDRGPEHGRDGGPVADEDRYLEIWNLVFMQDERGEQSPKQGHKPIGSLPTKNIDTGMGIERVATLLQGVENVYETDLVRPVIGKAEEMSGRRYGAGNAVDDVRFRVIADHARSGMMLIADGVTPGNEARGYVLRRLLRRIVRSVRLLGVNEPVLGEFAAVVRDTMSPSYPDLANDFPRIESVMRKEEEAFLATLVSGSKIFDLAADQVKADGRAQLPGDKAFQLHDTYGFPIDLTLEMAAEKGLSVDETGFRELMAEQRARAKADAASRKTGHGNQTVYRDLLAQGPTEFLGYETLSAEATVRGLVREGARVRSASEGEIVEVVLDRTPLYAESGGQESDAGTITAPGVELEVLDVQKVARKLWVHQVRVRSGEIVEGQNVEALVDAEWRIGARQGHSGTHVVHAALREVLGPTALQSGSYNKPGYLRLDFAWGNALSPETRSEIEEVSNLAVRKDLPVRVVYTDMGGAQDLGAVALFGETYDETVRVIEIGGPWSRELCGGTHVEHSSQIGPITLLGESSVGSGSRRLEAYVGMDAMRFLAKERALVQNLASMLKVPDAEVPGRVEALLDRLRNAEKELEKLRAGQLLSSAGDLADKAEDINGTALVALKAPNGVSGNDLRTLATEVRNRLGTRPGVVALFSVDGDKVSFVVATTSTARDAGIAAGKLVPSFSSAIEARGGGKPDMAQGGGTNANGVDEAVNALRRALGGS